METDELIRRSLDGDNEAFARLVAIYQHKIYNIAYRFFNNSFDAQDVAQETLIKIYRALGSYQIGRSFGSWVYMITINTCRDLAKQRKRHPVVSLDDEEKVHISAVLSDDGPSPEKSYLDEEAEQLLKKMISELPEIYREVIILREIAGLRYEEISDGLQISLGTVKSRINRGRLLLREKILKSREHSFLDYRYQERKEGSG